jgi:succinate dehydrogenase / fumarate reductase, flavoprotein subunit
VEHLSCDVLVLGSGAAGLRGSYFGATARARGPVVSKGMPGKATCTWFSGGVMAGTPDGEATRGHLERTLLAGRGTNQRGHLQVHLSTDGEEVWGFLPE